jgi:7-cyano-7-deazaguanine synthase
MKAICLFSGGKDSTVALAWSVENYAEVMTLSFNYRKRPTCERVAAREISARLFVKHIEIDLPFITTVGEVEKDLNGPPVTEAPYLPMRDLVFHSIALSIAESAHADAIVAGHIKSDGNLYRATTHDYLTRIYSVANSGTYAYGGSPAVHIELQLPLIEKTGTEVIQLGQALMAPLELSWSCLLDGPKPCGICAGCRNRKRLNILAL